MIDIDKFMHDWTYFGVNGIGTVIYINLELRFCNKLRQSLHDGLTYQFGELDNIIKRL